MNGSARGLRLILAIALLTALPGKAAVAIDNSNDNQGTGSSVGVSLTVAGTNRLMLVAVSYVSTGQSVSQVLVGATPLTEVCQAQSGTGRRTHIFRLVNPALGANTATATFTGAAASTDAKVVGVMTFTGVDQTTPLGTCVAAAADNVTVASAPGELVFDTMVADNGVNAAAGQTQRWQINAASAGGNVGSGASTKLGAASVTMSWTTSGGNKALAAVPIKSAVGPPAKVGFIVQPSTTAAGASIGPAVQVAIQDAAGNTVTTSSASILLAIGANPGAGTLSGTATALAVNGVATFSNLSIDKAGNGYTLIASSAGLTSATSSAFNVTAGAATKLAFIVQPSNVAAAAGIAPAVQVVVRDANDNTVTSSSASIAIAIGANPGGGALLGTTSVAASSGIAAFSSLSIDKAGAGYTLIATAGGLAGATSAAFDVLVGPAAQLAFLVQPSTSVAGAMISPPVQVAVQDLGGNVVASSSAPVAVALLANPGGGVLFGTAAASAANGIASFADLSITAPSTGYTVQATSAGLAPATSAPFDVASAPPIARSAACGTSFRYAPVVGSGPLTWTVTRADGAPLPDRLTLDPTTGEITWAPMPVDVGQVSLVLSGSNGVSIQVQQLDIDVTCLGPFVLDVGCGCAGAGESVGELGMLLLAVIALGRSTRRGGPPAPKASGSARDAVARERTQPSYSLG